MVELHVKNEQVRKNLNFFRGSTQQVSRVNSAGKCMYWIIVWRSCMIFGGKVCLLFFGVWQGKG